MKSLIQKFVEIISPAGYEAPIRAAILSEIQGYADEIQVDALGNIIARKGSSNAKGMKIMVAAHMDEIGLMATHIDAEGFVRFIPIGGVRPQTCIGERVRFLSGVRGVIGGELLEDAGKLHKFNQMYIDVGAKNSKDCPIKVGDIAAFDRPFGEIGTRLVAKALDDRIGVAVLVEALRQLKETPHRIFFVFSVQEEVGTRGAMTAAYGIDPDLGLAVDVTATGDTPKGNKMEVRLGGGPAITVRDAGMLADPRVVDWMVRTAQKLKIPYQLEVLEVGSTDARAMQLTRSGVPSGCLSIPCRYVHAPSEMVDYLDVQNALSLILALLSAPVSLG